MIERSRYRWTLFYRGLALIAVIAISLLVFSIRERATQFAVFGYPGVFLIALLANATVFLPAPGIAVVFTLAGVFNPIIVALAAGSGGTLGELTGYLAGYSGSAVAERSTGYHRLVPLVQKYGGWAILILAAIPNPFFDLAGIAAGVTKLSLWRFFLFCWLGQIIKMGLFSFAGYYSINWLSEMIK